MKTGSRYVAFGTRSLSVDVGMDHTTVATHLRELRSEPDPFVVLLEDGRGLAGDLYELRIPQSLVGQAARARWRAGKIHALRPAFRILGTVAAAVYETLEHAAEPLSSFEVSQDADLGRSSVYEALETLAAWNLARPDGRGRWTIARSTSPDRLAEAWGVLDQITEILVRHRAERAAWRRRLRIYDDPYTDLIRPVEKQPALPSAPELDEALQAAVDLLATQLGATPISYPLRI